MATNAYQQLLLDPRWQKKRLEIFNRDDWRCVRCGNNTETLHVHHAYYTHGVDPWEHPGDCLSTLCATCHSDEHKKDSPLARALARMLACFMLNKRRRAVYREPTKKELAAAKKRKAELRAQLEAYAAEASV
jgi:hypothetical protein